MKDVKRTIRFFFISDFEEEEKYLSRMRSLGWKFSGFTLPCFYRFEHCEPEEVIYKLDYRNEEPDSEYLSLFREFGWTYIYSKVGWNYFAKKGPVQDEEDRELYSDMDSKLDMLERLWKTRMLPLFAVFCCCLAPTFAKMMDMPVMDGVDMALCITLAVLLVVYLFIFIHCGTRFRKLRKKYSQK